MKRQSRINTISIITSVLLIAAGAGYYIGYVVPQREKLIKRNYRIIQRVSNTARQKMEGYMKVSQNSMKRAVEENLELIKQIDYADSLKFLTDNRFSLNGRIINGAMEKRMAGRFLADLNKYNTDLQYVAITYHDPSKPISPFYNLRREGDEWRIYGAYQTAVSFAPPRNYYEERYSTNEEDKLLGVSFYMPLEKFIHSILSRDKKGNPLDFDEMILVHNGRVLYQTMENGFQTRNADTLLQRVLSVRDGDPGSVSILGTNYRLFWRPANLRVDKSLQIVGMVKASRYQSEMMRLPDVGLFSLGMFLLLLVMAFPFLKLMLMSVMERLKSTDVVFTWASIFVGISILMILSMDFFIVFGPEKKQLKQDLEQEADIIVEKLYGEIAELKKFTEQTPPHDENAILTGEKGDKWPHYLNTLFWVDKEDPAHRQLYKATIRDMATPKISLRQRPYVNKILAQKAYPFPEVFREPESPDTTQSDIFQVADSFYLQSIVSWTTGEKIAVVSFPVRNISKEERWNRIGVVANSCHLPSLIDAVQAEHRGFCVVDETGLIHFHSDLRRNLQENLFEEIQKPELADLISGDTAKFVTEAYHGKDYLFCIKRLEGTDYYIATFQENIFRQSIHEQVVFQVMAMDLALFMLIAGMIILLTILFSGSYGRLKGMRYPLHWLRPKQDMAYQVRYQHLFTLNILLGIMLLIAFVLSNMNWEGFLDKDQLLLLPFWMAIFIPFISFMTLFPLRYAYEEGENADEKKLNYYRKAQVFFRNFTYLAGGTLIVLFALVFSQMSLWYGFLVLVICGIFGYFLVNINSENQHKWFFKDGIKWMRNYYNPYLFSLVLLFSLIPVYIFFHISYTHERVLADNHVHAQSHKLCEQLDEELHERFDSFSLQIDRKAISMDPLRDKIICDIKTEAAFLFDNEEKCACDRGRREDDPRHEHPYEHDHAHEETHAHRGEMHSNYYFMIRKPLSGLSTQRSVYIELDHDPGHHSHSKLPDALSFGLLMMFLLGNIGYYLIKVAGKQLFAMDLWTSAYHTPKRRKS